jgi:hypothetical protein
MIKSPPSPRHADAVPLPYGEYDDHVIKTLKNMGMNTIQWDVDSLIGRASPPPRSRSA